VRAALLERVLLPRREARVRAIRRARASGALREDLPPKIGVDLLWGPLFYRMGPPRAHHGGLREAGVRVRSGGDGRRSRRSEGAPRHRRCRRRKAHG
jgi:hypothetical protein